MRVVFGVFGVLVLLCGVTWIFQGNDFILMKYFSPKEESVRREVFEQSKAYNQGMTQELDNMYIEYSKASPEHKKALKSVVLHRVADYDVNKLPPHLKEFVSQLRNEKSF